MKEDTGTHNQKKEKKEKSDRSKILRIGDKLGFAQISELENRKSPEESKSQKEDEKDNNSFLSDILGPERIKIIKSKKSIILMGIGIIIGFCFLVFGAMMLMVPIEKVSDNVMFGEMQVFSVFFIFIGIIIIAISIAQKILGKSFFKEIDDANKEFKKKSSHSANNNIEKDNINRDNR